MRSRHERDSAHTTRHELLLPRSPRPTDAERKEATDLIAAMRALGGILARTGHINPERVACALAMHREEVFESEREMLRLFGLYDPNSGAPHDYGSATHLRRTWVDTKFPAFVLAGGVLPAPPAALPARAVAHTSNATTESPLMRPSREVPEGICDEAIMLPSQEAPEERSTRARTENHCDNRERDADMCAFT